MSYAPTLPSPEPNLRNDASSPPVGLPMAASGPEASSVAREEGTGKLLRYPEVSPDAILPYEYFWRDIQPWLKDRGYELRARYHPDWIPPWITNGGSRFDYGDHRFSWVRVSFISN